jgi:hypothetical protein
MFNNIFNALFGCSHRNTTFPQTPNRRAGFNATRGGTYVVCLDCGKEFGYDWQGMRVGKPVTGRSTTAATAESYSQ